KSIQGLQEEHHPHHHHHLQQCPEKEHIAEKMFQIRKLQYLQLSFEVPLQLPQGNPECKQLIPLLVVFESRNRRDHVHHLHFVSHCKHQLEKVQKGKHFDKFQALLSIQVYR